jgi:hypothetical protein
MRVAEALSRAHPKGRRQSVVPEGVRVMLLCGFANPITRNLDYCPVDKSLPHLRDVFMHGRGRPTMIATLSLKRKKQLPFLGLNTRRSVDYFGPTRKELPPEAKRLVVSQQLPSLEQIKFEDPVMRSS